MKAKKRGGLDSSNPLVKCPWQQVMIFCEPLWINSGIWIFHEHMHTHTHNPAKPFTETFMELCLIYVKSLSRHIHPYAFTQAVFLELHTNSLVPSLNLFLSLSLILSLAYAESLINISNFGLSNYFEISTLLRPQASPVSSLPRLPSLSPGSRR